MTTSTGSLIEHLAWSLSPETSTTVDLAAAGRMTAKFPAETDASCEVPLGVNRSVLTSARTSPVTNEAAGSSRYCRPSTGSVLGPGGAAQVGREFGSVSPRPIVAPVCAGRTTTVWHTFPSSPGAEATVHNSPPDGAREHRLHQAGGGA